MFALRCFTVWRTVLRSSLRSTAAGGSVISSVTLLIGSAFAGVYRLWAMFCMPGLRVPFRLKVPFLPSTKEQTLNVIKLLEGRKGHLADLGSGDGRLHRQWDFNAQYRTLIFILSNRTSGSSLIFQTDLSKYRNVAVFLAPAVMGVLEEKLLKKLPEDARVIVCRFPFPHWPHSCTAGSGLNQVWAYDTLKKNTDNKNDKNKQKLTKVKLK
uniref:Protein FAM173B-like n=1 Tax=Sinocyclocheilus rhinocerous TaxID=307959 RepID=A0A673JC76_9TELE